MLILEQVTAGYDGSDVLRELDLLVEDHSITCIVGPNGAGKSTVLRVISGLLKPRLGTLLFNGRSIGGLSPRQILTLGVVHVPQMHSVFPDMTVRENVRLGASVLNDRALVNRRLHEVEELFPVVKERAGEKAGDLSGGQQRLVEFARCLMRDPALILLDGPSVGLDPKTLRQVCDAISLMHQAGRTLLLVEQNVRVGRGLSTHGVIMENGMVRMQGPAATVLNDPAVSGLFFGEHDPTRGLLARGGEREDTRP